VRAPPTAGPFHGGELEAQRRAGVEELARRVGGIINDTIPAAAAAFLAQRAFVIAATVGGDGAVHASLLGGPRGFAAPVDPSTIELRPKQGHIEQVMADLEATGTIGLLAIDFATRRRMRANGVGVVRGDTIAISTSEVYSNCPQYIHERNAVTRYPAGESVVTDSLSEAQRQLIARSDTFFIASHHPDTGADASHRGGPPGFVETERHLLRWPDYSGNNMFNTLGNLLVSPRCGLLFVDWESGATLRIEGRAAVEWEGIRQVTVRVERVVEN
jgi:predicted pyridoxine 5'-phosphate oxidase superfamily flavin-nucleotide-binding protein